MRKELQEALEKTTAQLKRRLAKYETRNVVARFSMYLLGRTNGGEDFDDQLSSPAKQCAFAMSLLVSTPEPRNPIKFDDSEWAACVELLEELPRIYAFAYWPTAEEELSPRWREVRDVAVPAFIQYFNTGLVASTDQVGARIEAYLTPHDDELVRHLGLSATDALAICRYVNDKTQDRWDQTLKLAKDERSLRLGILQQWESEALTVDEVRTRAEGVGYLDVAKSYFAEVDKIGALDVAELQSQFGEAGRRFWELLSCERKKTDEVLYFAAELPFERSPLVRISDSRAAFVLPHDLFTATLLRMEAALSGGEYADRFLKARDKRLEKEVADVFGRLLPTAELYESVYETEELQYEHDVVVVLGDTCLVVEAKAAPPQEPFRDPDKAYQRLKRAFRSDRGIQKAYDQAIRLWRCWKEGKAVPLYNRKREVVVELHPEKIRRVIPVCITRDDFGPIATDLSLLLSKKDAEPYAWAPNILSLDFLADGWPALKQTEEQFLQFLEARIKLHGRVFISDELEVAG